MKSVKQYPDLEDFFRLRGLLDDVEPVVPDLARVEDDLAVEAEPAEAPEYDPTVAHDGAHVGVRLQQEPFFEGSSIGMSLQNDPSGWLKLLLTWIWYVPPTILPD